MTDHTIYIGAKGNQTTSAYPVFGNDHVTFHNYGADTLTVTFTSANSPLCKEPNEGQMVITVPAGADSEKLKICKNVEGAFAYNAQIGTLTVDDPIVIIERTMGGGFKVDATSALIGAIAGLLAGFVLTKLMKGGRARNPA